MSTPPSEFDLPKTIEEQTSALSALPKTLLKPNTNSFAPMIQSNNSVWFFNNRAWQSTDEERTERAYGLPYQIYKYIATDNGEIGYKAYQKYGDMLEITPVPTTWERLKNAVLEDAATRKGYKSYAARHKTEKEEQAMVDSLPQINQHLFN